MQKTTQTKPLRLVLLVFLGLSINLLLVGQDANRNQKIDEKTLVPIILIHGLGGSDLRQKKVKGLLEDGGFPNDVLKFKMESPQKLQFTEDGKPHSDMMSKNVIASGFYDVPGRNITDLSKFLKTQG